MPKIHFNGKTYNDIAEMPAMERQAYEQLQAIFKDENQDGVPDIFQGDVVGNILKAATTTVVVDGKQVSGLGALTPEQRARFEKGMSRSGGGCHLGGRRDPPLPADHLLSIRHPGGPRRRKASHHSHGDRHGPGAVRSRRCRLSGLGIARATCSSGSTCSKSHAWRC